MTNIDVNKTNKPLFLFLYHKNDLTTRINYRQLCRIEGIENIQPISDCQCYLPNTYRADLGKFEFPHWDSYWMCDGLIYKYILDNKQKILSRDSIVILEYDTWWNYPSDKWVNQSLVNNDVVGPEVLEISKNQDWDFFTKHRHLSFAEDLIGLRPFTSIACKSQSIVKAAEYVKNTEELHKVYNNEMRFATACKLSGSKIGTIPFNFKENIKWHQWECIATTSESIVHPIKNLSQYTQDAVSLSVVTVAFYDNENEKNEACNRLQKTLKKFNIELKVFSGKTPSSLQEAKIYKLINHLKTIDTEWVIFTDAKDVICVTNPIPKIELLQKYGKKILLSAEIICWPEEHLKDKFPYTKHHNPPAPDYKHLNSGVILARTEDLINHLEILISIMENNPELKNPWRTDQNIWQYLYLEQDQYGASIALDTDTNLSLSTFYIPVDSIIESEENNVKIPKFTLTNGCPSFLHFNGPDKHDINRINANICKWLNI